MSLARDVGGVEGRKEGRLRPDLDPMLRYEALEK